MAGFRCFWACWESFVPVGPGGGCCWESFVPVEPGGGCCWESFVPGEWWIGVGSGRKFSLLGGVVVEPGKSSPCALEMAGFRCFWACRESFVPVGPVRGRAGRVLYRLGPGAAVAGRVLYRLGPGAAVAGRVLYRVGPGVAVAGRVLYRVSGGLVVEAGENSPCSVAWWWNREKTLPAREKWPDFVDCGRAGRVLYRLGPGAAVAGRVLYRSGQGAAVAGRVLYRLGPCVGLVGGRVCCVEPR